MPKGLKNYWHLQTFLMTGLFTFLFFAKVRPLMFKVLPQNYPLSPLFWELYTEKQIYISSKRPFLSCVFQKPI